MIAYLNGVYLAKDEIQISPDDRGFLFADGLYEVVRGYRGRLFRLSDHLARLNYGARHLRLGQHDFSCLAAVARELISRNQLEDQEITVYFQVTRGAAPRAHAFPAAATPLTVYAAASLYHDQKMQEARQEGIRAITAPDIRWAHCDLKTTALTANVLANQQAKEAGAGEAIFMRDGVLLEGTHSNFMAVIDNTIVTAPLNNYILGGITRKVVLEICREKQIALEERPIFAIEIQNATELMVVGTITEVLPVIQLDSLTIGDGTPGPVARRLQEEFDERVRKAGASS